MRHRLKTALRSIASACMLLLCTLAESSRSAAQDIRDGDIIFHTSRSNQSVAIQKATHSKYTHMGIIFLRGGSPFVFEAINPVQYTPLETWIARGDGGHYVIKRLRDADQVLTADAVARLRQSADSYRGKPYDSAFGWSDKQLYCSELVWKVYDSALGIRIGRLQKMGDFDLTDAEVKGKLKERYRNRIPLHETVVSPGEMFLSEKLVVVAEQ